MAGTVGPVLETRELAQQTPLLLEMQSCPPTPTPAPGRSEANTPALLLESTSPLMGSGVEGREWSSRLR